MLKKQKEELKTIVCDFIQDENDMKYYMIQIKFVEGQPHREPKIDPNGVDYVAKNKIVK